MSQDARIAISLPAHPKTKKLVKRLGDGAAWKLVCLFLWASANRSDGVFDGMTAEDIELAVDWAGDDGAFVAALSEVGFLDVDAGTYTIHDWQEHNPWASGAELRSAKAKWNAVKRHHGELVADNMVPEWCSVRNATSSATSKDAAKDAANDVHTTSNAPSPSPSPSPSLKEKIADADASAPANPIKPKKPRRQAVTIASWLDTLGDDDAIRGDDPIFDYADKAGIPQDFLALSWQRFVEVHRDNGKRQADWPATYRNAVKSNWYRLWWFSPTGECQLTTTGEQARRVAA